MEHSGHIRGCSTHTYSHHTIPSSQLTRPSRTAVGAPGAGGDLAAPVGPAVGTAVGAGVGAGVLGGGEAGGLGGGGDGDLRENDDQGQYKLALANIQCGRPALVQRMIVSARHMRFL